MQMKGKIMRKLTVSTLTLVAALAGGAALAQSVSPGVAQLAASAGVSAEGFTTNQLIRLLDAQRENDRKTIAFILSQRGAEVSRTEQGTVNAGAAQLAASVGVDAGQFSLSELVRLDRALEKNDTATVRFILSGGLGNGAIPATGPGAQQMAAALGIDASGYTLSELTRLYVDRFHD